MIEKDLDFKKQNCPWNSKFVNIDNVKSLNRLLR